MAKRKDFELGAGSDKFLRACRKTVNSSILAPGVTARKSESKKLTGLPAIENRIATYGEIRNNEKYRNGLGMVLPSEVYRTGDIYHNAFDIMSYGGRDFSACKSTDGKQLCYSKKETKKIFIENLERWLEDPLKCKSEADAVVLGIEDNESWCNCPDCTGFKEKYGSDSAVMLLFIGDVAKSVNRRRMLRGKRPLVFVMFAYYATSEPPRGISVGKDVGVLVAPIKMRFRSPVFAPENEKYRRQIEGWASLTSNLYAWTYNFYTRNSFITYDTFETMPVLYKWLAGLGVKALYDQTESYQPVAVAWGRFKAYLQSELQWNPGGDVQKLRRIWFDGYFEEHAETMEKIFMETLALYARICSRHIPEPEYSEIGEEVTLFPCIQKEDGELRGELFSALTKWLDVFEREIKKSQTAGNMAMSGRIELERLQYLYWAIEVFPAEYGDERVQSMKKIFKESAEASGVTYCKENCPIGELWKRWDI